MADPPFPRADNDAAGSATAVTVPPRAEGGGSIPHEGGVDGSTVLRGLPPSSLPYLPPEPSGVGRGEGRSREKRGVRRRSPP